MNTKALVPCFALACISTIPAFAGPDFPYSDTPYRLPGLDTGVLQPKNTLELRIGTRQPLSPETDLAGTGLQTYDGGVTWRGNGRFALGWSVSVYDDATARVTYGSNASLRLLSAEIEGRYALVEREDFSAALTGSIGTFELKKAGVFDSRNEFGATIAAPMTWHFGRTDVTANLGATYLPDSLGTNDGPGSRAFAGLGLGYALTDRVYLYAATQQYIGRKANELESTSSSGTYAAGARFTLTPQSTATVYISSSQANTPILGDLHNVATGNDAIIGAEVSYTPSGKRFNIPRFQGESAAVDKQLTFGDGITLTGAAPIGTNALRMSYGHNSEGASLLSFMLSPDPDVQIEFNFENFQNLPDDREDLRQPEDDTRYAIGLRWQAMDQSRGAPFDLGLQTLFGRDIEEPTKGVLFNSVTAEYNLGQTTLRGNIRHATYQGDGLADDSIAGLGLGVDYQVTDTVKALAEVSGTTSDDTIWGLGLRYQPPVAATSIDAYATNATGLTGIGTLIEADEPTFGIRLNWQVNSRMF